MKNTNQKNYYELLGLLPGASHKDVEEAFATAKRTYSPDSVAAYSLFSKEEREEVLDELKEAYETLIDPQRRSKYDEELGVDRKALSSVVDMEPILQEDSDQSEIFQDITQRKANFIKPLIVEKYPQSYVTEQYRILFSRLESISMKESQKVFSITSAVKGEGKTVTALNLSYMMAKEFNKRVLLLEGDIRNPSFENYLKMEEGPGFTDLLNGRDPFIAHMCHVEDGFFCLPAGKRSKVSSELFRRSRLKLLFSDLRKLFDFIIIDSPPLTGVADTGIIAECIDRLLLVVKAGKTPKDMVMKAIGSLNGNNAKINIVLNYAKTAVNSYHHY